MSELIGSNGRFRPMGAPASFLEALATVPVWFVVTFVLVFGLNYVRSLGRKKSDPNDRTE